MKIEDSFKAPVIRQIWEDLVSDFLEMACFLTAAEQETLIRELYRDPVLASAIQVYPCFTIDNRMIVVREVTGNHRAGKIESLWVYDPKQRVIEKRAL